MKLTPEIKQAFKDRTGQEFTMARFRKFLLQHGENPTGEPIFKAPAVGPSLRGQEDSPISPAEAQAQIRRFAGQSRRSKYASLEEAAQTLWNVMEPAHQDIIKNVQTDMKWPMWVLFCGAVARACDNHELNVVDRPEWLNQTDEVAARATKVFCEACQLEIPNARRGQQFCCSAHGSDKVEHSPGCPAALLAGTSALPSSPTPHGTASGAVSSPAEPEPVPDGHCTLPGCGILIVNARRGQQRCCNKHGSDKAEHSEDCASIKAALAAGSSTSFSTALGGDESLLVSGNALLG